MNAPMRTADGIGADRRKRAECISCQPIIGEVDIGIRGGAHFPQTEVLFRKSDMADADRDDRTGIKIGGHAGKK